MGEIYLTDSTGQSDPNAYNLAKWNGHTWQLFRIQFYTFCGQQYTGSYPANAVAILSDTEIWIASNSEIAVWNGSKEGKIMCLPVSVAKIYAVSPNEVYTVGPLGEIGYYKNGTWQKEESGTGMDLYDINSTDGKTVYAGGGDYSNYNGILLNTDSNGKWQTLNEGRNIDSTALFNPYFSGIANTVWESSSGTVYFGGNLLYSYKAGVYSLVKTLPGNYIGGNSLGQYFGYISEIRGNGDNDIMLVGEGNTIRHYNGVRWSQLGMPYDYSSNYLWSSVAMKGNLAIAVGFMNRNAVIMVLKR